MAQKAVDIAILVIVVALIFPIAGQLIFNANTTGWDSNSKTVFGYIFLIAIVAIIILLLTKYVRHGKGE